jgi:UMF1 family MFS transporter
MTNIFFNKEGIKKGFLILSWALYDFANQFFALNIVSLYFVRWVTIEKGAPEIFYSITFGISTFLVAISTPVMGAISDVSERRKPFLNYLTILSIIFTIILGISDNLLVGLFFFAIANFGCQAAIVFYNALMVNIAPKNKIGLISGLGKTFGYLGAVLCLYLIRPIVLKSGYQATFLPTGVAFLIFCLPCLLFIHDKSKKRIALLAFFKKEKILEIFRGLIKTTFNTKEFPGLLDFLKAAFFGLCVVNVIILFMSVYATRAFGLKEIQIINLITFSTFFAIIGSFLSGYLSDRIGYKKSLFGIFILWSIILFGGTFIRNEVLYWVMGALVGITLGSTWVVSRAMAIRLAPEAKIGEVFGLFNFVGYLSGIVGALFWGGILLFLAPLKEEGYRMALFSLNIFLVFALIFIRRIPADKKIN